jgi:YVTN family beta-propeller protein
MKLKLLIAFLFSLIIVVAAQAAPKAYVAEFGSDDVAVIDSASNKVIKHIPIPKGAHGVVITPDGSRVFVSSDESSVISVINAQTDSIAGTIPTGKAPHGLAVSQDGSFVYAAIFGDNQVLQIDTRTLKVAKTLEAPQPHNLAISRDNKTLFVAAQQPGKTGIDEIDVASGKEVTFIATDTVPRSLNLNPGGDVLTSTQYDHSTLQIYSTNPLKQITTVTVGDSPHHTIFTPDGKLVLVCSQQTNDVSLIDAKSWKLVAKVPVGQKPHWIAPSSDSKYAYVTDEASGQVSVLDLEDKKVDETIQVGNAPRKIAIQAGNVTEADEKESTEKKVTVLMQGPPRFMPATLMIEAGTTVEWINNGTKVHTVTGEHASWDSGSLEPGEKFSHRFDQKGTFAYFCVPHQQMGMVGTIIVN